MNRIVPIFDSIDITLQLKRLADFLGTGGSCTLCTRFARLVARLDWRRRIINDTVGAHAKLSIDSLTATASIELLQAIDDETKQIYSGYAAIVQIAMRLPIFTPAMPLLLALGYIGAGETVYHWITSKYCYNKPCVHDICEAR